MSMKEVNAIIKYYNERYINSWEQVRLIRNTIGACMGVKLQPLTFSWDNEDISKIPEKPTKEERIEIEQNVYQWLDNLNIPSN